MNFDQAIAAHSAWKQKLADYLAKHDGSLKHAEITLDNKCLLGQWIYGEGSQYSNLAEYSALKAEHARFHKAASEVVRKADSGHAVSEETALGAKSDFLAASSAVVMAIMHIKTHVAK
jgi:hypothetical protein